MKLLLPQNLLTSVYPYLFSVLYLGVYVAFQHTLNSGQVQNNKQSRTVDNLTQISQFPLQ